MNQATGRKTQSAQAKWLFWVLLFALGLVAVWFMRYLTPEGMGLVNDSVGYIGGARNIAAGNGYSRLKGNGEPAPITNFPPFFSIVLAGISLLGPDPIEGSLVLNVLLYGANVMMMGLLTRQATGSGLWGLAGAVLLAATEPFFRAHTFTMSDPLYLFLSFVALWSYVEYNQTKRWLWLATSGLFASLAFITRYVGVSLYGTVTLCLLLFSSKEKETFINWRRFLKDMGIFLTAGMPIALLWLGRNFIVSSNAGNRQLLWHPVTKKMLEEGMVNFWGWLFPEVGGWIERYLPLLTVVFFAMLLLLVAGVFAGFVFYKREKPEFVGKQFKTGWVFALHALMYLTMLVITLTILDASPIFENRILLPVYISLIVVFVVVLSWMWRSSRPVLMAAAMMLALGLLVSFAEDGMDAVAELRQDGQGFAHSSWAQSDVVAAVKELDDVTLYSNKITAIYILTGKPAYVVPSPFNPATRLPREGYEEDMANIHEDVLAGRAVMVIFDYYGLKNDPEDAQWMEDIAEGMPVLRDYEDGVIFGIDPKN